MGIPQLSQRGHLPEPEKHWCAVLHSSYYLELPVFLCVSPSSLLFYFPLILYSTLFTFPAKTNTRIFKLCIAKAVFWHTEEIYTYIYNIFPMICIHSLTTYISLNRWGTEGKLSHCFSKIWNIFPNVRIWPYISHTVKLCYCQKAPHYKWGRKSERPNSSHTVGFCSWQFTHPG